MAVSDSVIRIHGLRELERAFRVADREEAKLLRATLKQTAAPVKRAAEGKAVSRIRNIGGRWSKMRIGFAGQVVYLAPKERGRASRANRQIRRPNLKDLLLDRAMIPALAENESEVVRGIETMLNTVGRKWEQA